jgi:hypothetical protein
MADSTDSFKELSGRRVLERDTPPIFPSYSWPPDHTGVSGAEVREHSGLRRNSSCAPRW